MRSYVNIFKQEGTSRNERNPDSLNPNNISIDDRKLEDFIIYAREYSKNLLFIDTEQEEIDFKKSWEEFFRDDSVLLSAYIATKDINEVKAAYDYLFDKFEKEGTIDNFMRVVEHVFARFKNIDQWYASSSSESILNQDLYLYIKSYLAKEFQKLNQIILYINNLIRDSKKQLSLSTELINKGNIWELTEKQSVFLGENMFAGNTDKEKLYNALLYTNKIFDGVFHATSKIIDTSRNFFKDAIYKQQNLSPHITLLITFLHLFGVVREQLNRIPGILLDFYYKDVLKIKPKKAVPDQAFIIFELTKGFDSYKIEKGIPLLAGKDKNKVDLVYKTDKEIIINKARVSSLKTIFTDKINNLITYYYRNTIKENEKLVIDSSTNLTSTYRTFGAPERGNGAKTGFAISSSQLYLSKGERNVTITFETEKELVFQEWADFDVSIIELLLTGEKGWLSSNVPGDSITINYLRKTDAKSLELNFRISIAQASAIVDFDPLVHTDKFHIRMPVLKILLQFPDLPFERGNEIPDDILLKIKQLNFLLSLSIVRTTVTVQVGSIGEKVTFDGIRDLHLENHEAVLDPKKPFHPFTSMPKVGSSFYINCNEFFYKKNIENLTINIDWMLPDNFYSYYDKYFPPYDSNKFQASLSVLRDQYWTKLKDISIIDTNADEPRYRVIKVPNKVSPQSDPGDDRKDVSKFDMSKKEGTLRLKLNYPDFGHDIYAQLITSIALEKSSSKRANVDFYKIIEKEFGDSDISIKLPPVTDPSYRINRVLDILRDPDLRDRAKGMIIEALNYSLINYNGVTIPSRGIQQASLELTRTLVNDPNNFVARILKFLKKIKLIGKSIHFDEEKDTVAVLVDNVEDKLMSYIDFILPADQEMVTLIISAVNSAIRKVIVKAVDKIIEVNNTQQPDDNTITAIITKEFDSANKVINDLVAGKIASLLLAYDVPPKPYTPLINTISISYTSVKELNKEEDRFFHILPFGITEIDPSVTVSDHAFTTETIALRTNKMFPRSLISLQEDNIPPSGILFIGIKELAANENLSLFFQFDQGTKRSDKKPPTVSWWYLKNNEWIALKNDFIISDSTYGMQISGIVEITIPQNINNQNTIFDEAGQFWLCASVTKDLEAFPDLVDTNAQAVSVTFENNADNDPAHLAFPLPSQKITKLALVLPGIKTIRQPEASFNGKVEEIEPEYYARVSERLRHKSRAVNNWDFERLILEHFPSIYKVKCLNNYYQGQFVPGHVTVVPIINLKNRLSDDFHAELPSVSYLELRRIEEFVQRRSSVFAKIHAINPQPNYVKINCRVKFKSGRNKGYYLQKLNEDLIKFLTPWAGESKTASFSTKIYSSSIISFIDKREYVDYVADLSMNQFTISKDGTINYCRLENQMISLTETQITSAHSILVSAREHNIELM